MRGSSVRGCGWWILIIFGFLACSSGAWLLTGQMGDPRNAGINSGMPMVAGIAILGVIIGVTMVRYYPTPPTPVFPIAEADQLLSLEYYVIRLPAIEPFNGARAETFVTALLKQVGTPTLALVVEARRKQLDFMVGVPEEGFNEQALTTLVQRFFPGAYVELAETVPLQYPIHQGTVTFKNTNRAPFFEHLKTIHDMQKTDALAILTQAMSNLQADELIQYVVVITGNVQLEPRTIDALLTLTEDGEVLRVPENVTGKPLAERTFFGWLAVWQSASENMNRLSQRDQTQYREKLSQTLSTVHISLRLLTPEQSHLHLLESLATPVKNFSPNDLPIFSEQITRGVIRGEAEAWAVEQPAKLIADRLAQATEKRDTALANDLFVVTTDELAAMWHLPYEGFTQEAWWYLDGSQPLPEPMRELKEGILIGHNKIGQQKYDVHLPYENREIPTTVIGRPGRGKSSLIHHMIHHDIATGKGLCLIDPKGTLVSRVLQHSIPKERENDVVVLDVVTKVDGEWYPPPLNLLGSSVEISEDIAAGKLITIFEELFEDFADKRMADTLNMALMALATKPDATIWDVYYFLSDINFRAQASSYITDPIVTSYWTTFDGYKESQQKAMVDPILWRLRSFYRNRYLRAMTGQTRHLDLTQMVKDKKIILVSVAASENLIPERERYVLGAYLISQIDMVARENIIGDVPFMLYIDETQEFVRTALPTMLSQLREYRLGLVLVNQYYKQLVGNTLDAIEGTASTMIGFEVGRRDAEALAAYMRPEFTADDFMSLGNYKAGVSLVYNNERQRPFTLETLPPPGYGQINPNREVYLRKLSVDNLKLKPYSEVIQEIQRKYGDNQPPFTPPDNADGSDDDEFFE